MNENKINELFEILSKEHLTKEEELSLNNLLKDNSYLKNFYEAYKKLETLTKLSVHLSTEDLANYLLVEQGMKSLSSTENLIIKKIKTHIKTCNSCKEEYNLLAEEYTHLERHLSDSLTYNPQSEENKIAFLSSVFQKKHNFTRYSFIFTVLIVFVYFSAFLISNLTRPNYVNSASIKSEKEFYTTRSRGTEDFQKSLSAFDNDDFDNGFIYLEKDIADNSNDETIFYSYYILGIAYLQSAEKDYLGLFKSFNDGKVEKGINNLILSFSKNNSGNFNNILFNSYYYLAKGYLMKNNLDSAKIYLNKIIINKGGKMNDAIKLLDEIR